MLHAPDFLGFPGAVEMAQKFPQDVERGLQLKKVGNELVSLLGGRSVHPINVRVGGFHRVPDKTELLEIREKLLVAQEAAYQTVNWCAGFDFPEFEMDYHFVALTHPNEYPMNEGKICSNKGLDIDVSNYDQHFVEEHVSHSTALHSHLKNHGN